MRKKSLPFALLSCVTSEEHAAAIEGDLIEERAARGKVWFAIHVIRTAFALSGFAVTQAPVRTAALSAGAVAASLLMCFFVGRAFFGPEALAPTPVLGFAAIAACAVLIGVALARVAGAVGVRAAAATALLLCTMFVVAQLLGGFGKGWSAEAIGAFVVNFGLALCLYPAPLLAASACAHARRL